MVDVKILEEIGLTKSEIKVYLALLKLGASTKKNIVKEAKITHSKLYEITDKLIEKGLVSYVKRNKVMHFSAAPPEQVLDFLELKKEKISKQANEFEKLIPSLKSLKVSQEPEVEVFKGWKGMRTAYQMMLRSLKSGEVDYVVGATSGEDIKSASRFFENIHRQRREKKIVLKIILNKKDQEWALSILRVPKYDKVRLISHQSPSEVNIWRDNVMIIMLTKVPVLTLIRSKFVADSFRNYFDLLWKTAKKV